MEGHIEEPIPQNSFNTISIEGLLYSKGNGNTVSTGSPVSAIFERIPIPIDLVDIFPHPEIADLLEQDDLENYEPGGPPPRRSSQLPLAGHDTLGLRLGKMIGFGRTGIIYEALHTCLSSPNATRGYIPPLVVKIARRKRCQSLVREAWFYEEMECIQGVAIPRYYGCFKQNLERGSRVHPWNDPRCYSPDTDPDYCADFVQYPDDSLLQSGISPHPLLEELILETNAVYVTVLERLGPELRPGVSHPLHVQEDIEYVYDNISALGIAVYDDMCRENILQAPVSPPGLPSLKSPFTNRTHAYRVVDFEWAEKMPLTRRCMYLDHVSWLFNMFACIMYWDPPFTPPPSP